MTVVPLWALILSWVLPILGIFIVAWFGYIGARKIAVTKADLDEVNKLKLKIADLEHRLESCEKVKDMLTDEKLDLLERLFRGGGKINKIVE